MISFTPFPNLQTERLILRPLQPTDENELFFHRSDDRMLKFIDRPKARTLEEVRSFMQMIDENVRKDESILWAIQLKTDPRLIGTICFWNVTEDKTAADIGYALHPDFQGKGLMQEAMEKAITFGFDHMRLQTIKAEIHADNIKSIRLVEKYGFVFEENSGVWAIYVLKRP
jgi:ribosomal-protein-alanine N-acetyltransferase